MTKLVEMVPRKFVGNLHYLVQAAKFPRDLSELAYWFLLSVQECMEGVFKEFILEIDNWVE